MTQLAKVYGGALYDLCAEEALEEQMLQEVEQVTEIFRENPAYVKLLDAPTVPKAERIKLVQEAMGGQVHGYLLNFMKILCERGELSAFADCAEAFAACYYQAHGIVKAVAVSAVAMTQAQQTALCSKLKAVTGKEILLSCKVDPAVLGGVRLSMDGYQFDSTVKHRLDKIRANLLGSIA